MIVYRLGDVFVGKIVKRPSKNIKSPYVADVNIDGEEHLAHTPSLGCSGLCECPNKVVMIETPGNKCGYRIQLAKEKKVYVGVNPKISENIVINLLRKNKFPNLDVSTYQREVSISNSRFDFAGKTKDCEFIIEVKSVPLKFDDKTAYFPEGYRKKKSDPISPRALKHIQELTQIKKDDVSKRCILCFVVSRHDVEEFKVNENDPIYQKAVQDGWMSGVEIVVLCIKWSKSKGRLLDKSIPINLYSEYGPQNKIDNL